MLHNGNIVLARFKFGIVRIISVAVLDKVGNPVNKNRGFSAACTCKKQQGAIYCIDSLLLPVIHSFKIFCNYTAAKF